MCKDRPQPVHSMEQIPQQEETTHSPIQLACCLLYYGTRLFVLTYAGELLNKEKLFGKTIHLPLFSGRLAEICKT